MWGAAPWSNAPNKEGFSSNYVLGDSTGKVLFDSEPIVAFRAWRLDDKDRLRSVSRGIHWPVRKPMRAHCLDAYSKYSWERFAKTPHPCPFLGHTCGIYAVLDREKSAEWIAMVNPRAVVGTVSLWGRVLCFEQGYRAEYAYPAGFFEMPAAQYDVHWLADLYGVPVLG